MPVMFVFYSLKTIKTTFIDIFTVITLWDCLYRLLEKHKLVQDTCKKDVRMRLNNYGGSIIFS